MVWAAAAARVAAARLPNGFLAVKKNTTTRWKCQMYFYPPWMTLRRERRARDMKRYIIPYVRGNVKFIFLSRRRFFRMRRRGEGRALALRRRKRYAENRKPVGQDRLILTRLPPSYGCARTTETTGCLSYRWRVPPLAPFGIRRSRTTDCPPRCHGL